MTREEITDTFHVRDEQGDRFRIQEISVYPADQHGEKSAEPVSVYYRFDDGRIATAYLAARQFRDEDSGAFYDRE